MSNRTITKQEAQKRVSEIHNFNDKVDWETYKDFSKNKTSVLCHRCGEFYDITLKNLIKGNRCLSCSYKDRTKKLVKTLSKDDEKILSEKYFSVKVFNGKSMVNEFKCDICNHEFSCSLKLVKSKSFFCPNCKVDEIELNERNIERINNYQKRLDELSIEVEIIKNKFHGVLNLSNFKCLKCDNLFNGYLNNMFVNKKSTCNFCRKSKDSYTLEHYEKMLNNKNYRIMIDSDKFISCNEKVNIKHLECDRIFEKRISDLVYNKQLCPFCSRENRSLINKEDLINRMNELGFEVNDPQLIKNTTSLINVKCRRCLYEMEKVPIKYILNGKRCRKCSKKISKGEKKIFEFLSREGIEFDFQLPFKNDESWQYFDFFLKKQNLVIEYDGEHHFKPIEHFGGNEYLEYTKKNDERKNEYCKSMGYDILRISYTDYDKIDDILMERCMR